MRISDWSSYVCSSDLGSRNSTSVIAGRNLRRSVRPGAARVLIAALARVAPPPVLLDARHPRRVRLQQGRAERLRRQGGDTLGQALDGARSEERLVGKGGVSTCKSRWSPHHKKKTK